MAKIVCPANLLTILLLCISVVLCQDRILVVDESLNEDPGNLTVENEAIPESLLIRMKDVHNVSEFIRLFATPDIEDLEIPGNERPRWADRTTVTNNDIMSTNLTRRIKEGQKRRIPISSRASKQFIGTPYDNKQSRQSVPQAATIAQPANCQTEQHVIELDKPENGATIYWPACVRVRRCGGCCTSNMLACKPLASSILNVTVLKMQYNHNNPGSFETQGTKVFSLEQHDRCSCTCKEREDDCNLDVHEYKGDECRCVCKNKEEAPSCTGPKKIWDSKDCFCKCRKIRICSTGSYFNIVSCRCEILKRSLAVETLDHRNTSLSRASNTTSNASHSLQ